jgi:flagellar protein FliL
MAESEKLDLGEEKPQSSKKTLIIVVVAVLVTVAAVLGALYFLGIVPPKHGSEKPAHDQKAAEKVHEEAKKPVLYLPLSPPFSANFKNNPEARVVQVDVTVASTDTVIIEAMKKHAPMLRNNILLLLSGEDPAVLKTTEGKEALRGKIKEAIKKVIVSETDRKEGVDQVFFTGFIMQ